MGAHKRVSVGLATCANAAQGGHLEVLQWVHENGCPWDRFVLVAATAQGHLEVLKLAIANGCPELE